MNLIKRLFVLAIPATALAVMAAAAGWLALQHTADAQTDLPAPANVQVVDGDQSGQAVLSWDAVPDAVGYRVQWMNNLDATRIAYETGHPWEQATQSVDIVQSGVTTYTLAVNHLSPGTSYSFIVGTKSGPSASPNWSEWVALKLSGYDDSADIYDVVLIQNAALAIIRHSSALVATGSAPTQIGMTQDDLKASRQTISGHKNALDQQLAVLAGRGDQARSQRVQILVHRLVSNVEAIQSGRPRLLRELAGDAESRRQLRLANSTDLFPNAAASVDRQFYGLMTSFDDAGAGDSSSLSKEELLAYSHTRELSSDAVLGHTFLLVASLMRNPTFVAQIQESYDSAAESLRRNTQYLAENGSPDLNPRVLPLAQQMLEVGGGENNYFDRLENRLRLTAVESALIADNAEALAQLLVEIDGLVAAAQGVPVAPVPMMPVEDGETPGFTDDTVRFGQSAALSGPASALGQGMELGIQAAFKEANDAGGVHGRQLQLKTLDDRYETELAFAQTRRLIENESVFGLIGAVGTPTSRAASPLAHYAGVPFIGPFTGAEFLRDSELDNVLNLRASYNQETAEMVERLTEDLGITKVAVLYQNDSYGKNGLEGVRRALKNHDPELQPVASWYYRRNTEAVQSAAFRIADAEPEAVIIIGAYSPTAAAIELLRERLDPDPIFMVVSFVGSNALAEALGDAGEGVYVTQVVPLPGDDTVPVVADYRTALSGYDAQAEPGFISLEGYLVGRLTIEALEACGPNLSRECFLDSVRTAQNLDLNGLSLQYGPADNQGSDAVFLTVIGADGQYHSVDKLTPAP